MIKSLSAMQETGVQSLGWEISWRRDWLPTPVLLPAEFHGKRRLVSYSPWGYKESDITKQLTHMHSVYVFPFDSVWLCYSMNLSKFSLNAICILSFPEVLAYFLILEILCACVLSCIWLFVICGTIAHQAPLSMDFLGKNTGVGCHFLLQRSSWPRDRTHISYVSCIAGRFLTSWAIGEAYEIL